MNNLIREVSVCKTKLNIEKARFPREYTQILFKLKAM